MKPDATKVANIKHGSYDKLNDKGYVPEETKIENGDAIFGKVTPVSDPTSTGKPYRDSSEIFKMHASGVVDRMYIDIQNQEGYLTREALVRSERIPKIGDKYCCYSDDTEILTTEGWILFKDLTMKHKVATLINGDTLVYQHPLEVQHYDYDGEMYKVKSNQIDLLVTPNHGMWVKRHGSKHFRREEAQDIHGKIVQYKKNANKTCIMEASKYIRGDKFVLPACNKKDPEKLLDLDAFIELFGIWIAEGYETVNSVRFAANKPRVKKALDRLCVILDYTLCKNQDKEEDNDLNSYRINNSQLASYFHPFSVGAVNKYLPTWVWSLNMKQCRILIDGMTLGDGHKMKGTTTRRYDTSSKKLADDFQRLCLHAGYSCNIAIKYKAGHSATIQKGNRKGTTITSTVDAYRMSIITTQNEPKVNKNRKTNPADSYVKYKGKVHCCTVLGTDKETFKANQIEIDGFKRKGMIDNGGILYVRRNKVSSWSGNSRHGQKGTIGILLDGVDMPFNKYGVRPDIILNPNAIPSKLILLVWNSNILQVIKN